METNQKNGNQPEKWKPARKMETSQRRIVRCRRCSPPLLGNHSQYWNWPGRSDFNENVNQSRQKFRGCGASFRRRFLPDAELAVQKGRQKYLNRNTRASPSDLQFRHENWCLSIKWSVFTAEVPQTIWARVPTRAEKLDFWKLISSDRSSLRHHALRYRYIDRDFFQFLSINATK